MQYSQFRLLAYLPVAAVLRCMILRKKKIIPMVVEWR